MPRPPSSRTPADSDSSIPINGLAHEALQRLCQDLRLIRQHAGAPSLRRLAGRVKLGKSQVSAILNGDIRRLPDWEIIKGLVEACHEAAQERGLTGELLLHAGADEFWRPRYAMLEYAFQQERLRRNPTRGPAPSHPVPRQLPPAVRHFGGRHRELAELTALANRIPAAGTVVITAIGGTAGVGKTALAVYWAHRVSGLFPDGQLYVDLRGFGPSDSVMDPGEALRRFLDALEVPAQRIPADLEAQVGLYRSLLADRRMVVVLDNARDAAQVRPLLPGAASSLVVVTSRNRLSGLVAAEGAHSMTLDVLGLDEAREMLAHRLGGERVAAEPDAVAQIVDGCARLPLALAIVAARAATDRHLPLRTLADQLDAARLDTLTTAGDPHTDVRGVFSWSYHALSPPTAHLFRLLGLHPGPDITLAAAASLAASPSTRVGPLLTLLTNAGLLIEHQPGRYTFHDLLRAYAADLSRRIDTGEHRRAAVRRILDHYLHTAYSAARLLHPNRDPLSLNPPGAGVTAEPVGDHHRALGWFTAEHAVLLAAVNHAAATGFDTHTWQLAWSMWTFFDRRGLWRDQVTTGQLALAAARSMADPAARAFTHRHLASAYIGLGRFAEAEAQLRSALRVFKETDRLGRAHTHFAFAVLIGRMGRHADALDHARQAHGLYRAVEHRRGEALARNVVGWHHAHLGEFAPALAHCGEALTLLRELGDVDGQADTWDSLGFAHHRLGHHAEAISCYENSLALYRNLSDRYHEAVILAHLGDVHRDLGENRLAGEVFERALAILDDLEHPDRDQIRVKVGDLNGVEKSTVPPGHSN